MNYTQLSETYKYDIIADAIYARELEYFHYDFDRKNFKHLLLNEIDAEFAKNIAERLKDTEKQMQNVLAIIDAIKSQIDNEDAYNLAVKKCTEKRLLKEAE